MSQKIQRWFPNTMPAPIVDAHTHPWWQACAGHRLTAQLCKQCHHAQLPPAPICSECHGNDFELVTLNGQGTLYTYTAVYQPVSPEQKLPFVIAVVELDVSGTACKNGVRVMTNIVDAEVHELQIGKPVQVAWETMSQFVSIPRFKFT
jgi:uncharacterized OB-fold protein